MDNDNLGIQSEAPISSGDMYSPQNNFKSSRPKWYRQRRTIIIGVILGVILLGVIIVSIYLYVVSNREEAVYVPICSDEILSEASPLIASNSTTELPVLAKEIQALPGYETDVNCLYIVTFAYTNIGDVENSRKFYDKLAAVYAPEVGYSTKFIVRIPPDDIKRNVESLEQQNKRMYDNIGGPV